MVQLILRIGIFQLSDIFYNTLGGVLEYSANGRPLVTVEKSTQYAGQVHLTKKMNTVGSPQLI